MLLLIIPVPVQPVHMILAIWHALHVAINVQHALLQQPTVLHVEGIIEDQPHLVPAIMGILMLEQQIAKHATTFALPVSQIQLIVKAAMAIIEDQPHLVPAIMGISRLGQQIAKHATTTVLPVSQIQLIVKAAKAITEDQPLAVRAQLAIMM
jgi:hypothetical protein